MVGTMSVLSLGGGDERREFIKLLGGAAAAWPLASCSQQPPMPVVGFLSSRSPVESELEVAGFRRGLAQAGYVEHQNVAIDYRWAENQYDRLPALAADLVKRQVRVIAALGGPVPRLRSRQQQKPFHSFLLAGLILSNLVLLIALPSQEVTRLG